MKLPIRNLLFWTVPLLCPPGAGAADIPQVKPGLWEVRMQSSTNGAALSEPRSSQICWDAATLAESRQKAETAEKKQDCSKYELHQVGNKWIKDGVCKVGASSVTAHVTREFPNDSTYHDESAATYQPPMSGRSQTKMIVDGKWLKPC